MGHLRLTIGYLKATVVHIRVTLGHLKVTIGNFFSELHPKVRPTCSMFTFVSIYFMCAIFKRPDHCSGGGRVTLYANYDVENASLEL